MNGKTVGSAHTRKLFEKSLIKNFIIKIAKTARFLGGYCSSKMRLRILQKFLPRFFKKRVGV